LSKKKTMQQDYKKHNGNWGMSLSIGISLGTGIGALMGNIGVGMTFGVALGTTLSLLSCKRSKTK
jgi:galactitol-specific phosphotransferase system IIC component